MSITHCEQGVKNSKKGEGWRDGERASELAGTFKNKGGPGWWGWGMAERVGQPDRVWQVPEQRERERVLRVVWHDPESVAFVFDGGMVRMMAVSVTHNFCSLAGWVCHSQTAES